MKKQILIPLLVLCINVAAQKKPLDHTVYDDWKSAGERMISNDGKFIVYTVNAQEGDGELVIQNAATRYKKVIPRGYNAVITEDSRYVVFKIKPVYQDTRQARIKKKKPDDMPKDSLAIIALGTDSTAKIARVRNYKAPEKAAGWVAYLAEKPLPDTTVKKRTIVPDSLKTKIDLLVKIADSVIKKSLDSVKGKIEKEKVLAAAQKAAKEIYKQADDFTADTFTDADGDDGPGGGSGNDGTELTLKHLGDSKGKTFKWVSDYLFDKKGTRLLMITTKNSKDSASKACIILYNLQTEKADTIMRGFNETKNYVFDEEGRQLAFIAERDRSAKALQRFYKLWYYTAGQDSAKIAVEKNTAGMRLGNTASENAAVNFSKDGSKLFFGVAAVKAPRDTTLVDFELARVDVWHYNDDYLQPQQLKQLDAELKRSYAAVTRPGTDKVIQLGADDAENIQPVNEGNAGYVLAISTKGSRISSQWTGRAKQTAYIISTSDGSRKLVKKEVDGFIQASPQGNYIYWYDLEQKQYFTYAVATGQVRNVTEKIKVPLYDTENDVPDYPGPAGFTGWTENDADMLLNDEFDIWKVDPSAQRQPENITNGFGRKNKISFDYVRLDKEKRFITTGETILLRTLNKDTKYGGLYAKTMGSVADPVVLSQGPYSYINPVKATNAEAYVVQRSSIGQSELFASNDLKSLTQLTDIASQQKPYNWLTAELVHWKMFDGKMSEGILYKPENFDPNKKYPVIFYFYERDADGLYNYRQPAPSASTINVPYFVSNGYLVFDPNIYYKTGEPGQSAYNSVVSAARYLAKMPWVDSTRMALQGQSWGGYQVAYLVTRTNMFRAAEAGAPVANMTSAYGGIRWGAGINRQFQYEKSQSRIGATLWQRPELYIKNSPLFAADKVTTPLLIMHNDADGAVPWYQGIEYFTALRRLGKKVWLLEYNGEDHNLVERKNRKDLSVRLAQFFDYYLKDAPAANWIKYGLPATEKGKDWGLKTE